VSAIQRFLLVVDFMDALRVRHMAALLGFCTTPHIMNASTRTVRVRVSFRLGVSVFAVLCKNRGDRSGVLGSDKMRNA